MKKKVNILQLVNGLAVGGGELKMYELTRELLSRYPEKYDITVCSVGQGGPLADKFEKLGIPVSIFPKKMKFDISLVFKVARLMRIQRIHIVQTTLFYADVIGSLAALLAKVPIVLSWEVTTHPFRLHHLWAYRLASWNMDRIIAVSDAIKKQVSRERGIPSGKIMTIHYGVDIHQFRKANYPGIRRYYQFSKSDILLGVVARLTEQKGHRYLIEAAPTIVNAFPQTKFLFIGDGPLREQHRNHIVKLGLESRFFFLGFQREIAKWLNLLDIFVLPSLYEGLPNAVLEAMACERPIIATSVDGTPEAIRHGITGFLVPPRNSEALAKWVIHLLNRRSLMKKVGLEARRVVENRFSLDVQVQEFEDLYNFYYERK